MSQNGGVSTSSAIFEIDDDFSRFSEKPKPIITERKRSFDEKSFSKMSIAMSPRPFYRNTENSSRVFEPVDSIYSSGGRPGFDTPRSDNGFETHPIVSEAWEALRQSMVYFRNEPVGTIAATDHSEDKLNYDQASFSGCSAGVHGRVVCGVAYLSVLARSCGGSHRSDDSDSEIFRVKRRSALKVERKSVIGEIKSDYAKHQGLKRLKKFQPERRFGEMVPGNHSEYNSKSDVHLKDGKVIGLRDIPHKGSIVPVSIKVKRAAGEGPSIRHREHPSSGRFHQNIRKIASCL